MLHTCDHCNTSSDRSQKWDKLIAENVGSIRMNSCELMRSHPNRKKSLVNLFAEVRRKKTEISQAIFSDSEITFLHK